VLQPLSGSNWERIESCTGPAPLNAVQFFPQQAATGKEQQLGKN
jgi:hypothetical protein